MQNLLKYPRTPHLEGSRLQPGDEDLSQVSFSEIRGKIVAVEEKLDGANCAVSFSENGQLLLQSRGHYLTGGLREKHFNLFKQWAIVHHAAFYEVLGSRYIMYGEWLYAKHTVFYNALPHYFMEFDLYDREKNVFLDTPSRRVLLRELPIRSVPVLRRGTFNTLSSLVSLVGHSLYIHDNHRKQLFELAETLNLDPVALGRETDPSTLMEGLYLKVESSGKVVRRLKFVRPSFLQTVIPSESHWLNRPIVPNLLSFDVSEIYAPQLPKEWRYA